MNDENVKTEQLKKSHVCVMVCVCFHPMGLLTDMWYSRYNKNLNLTRRHDSIITKIC